MYTIDPENRHTSYERATSRLCTKCTIGPIRYLFTVVSHACVIVFKRFRPRKFLNLHGCAIVSHGLFRILGTFFALSIMVSAVLAQYSSAYLILTEY